VESWDTFAVVVGSAAAAQLGLLFVAISIRRTPPSSAAWPAPGCS
jgi:hypothetical protein